MKHLKMYEDLFSQSKFKVGDYVRCKDNTGLFEFKLEPGTNYFQIISISDTAIDNSDYKYLLHNIVNSDIMDFLDQEDNLELVPEHEINAIKYNL